MYPKNHCLCQKSFKQSSSAAITTTLYFSFDKPRQFILQKYYWPKPLKKNVEAYELQLNSSYCCQSTYKDGLPQVGTERCTKANQSHLRYGCICQTQSQPIEALFLPQVQVIALLHLWHRDLSQLPIPRLTNKFSDQTVGLRLTSKSSSILSKMTRLSSCQ